MEAEVSVAAGTLLGIRFAGVEIQWAGGQILSFEVVDNLLALHQGTL